MSKNKKSIILYSEWLETFDNLTDDEAGKLIKHIFRYVNDKNPEAPDRITEMLFIPIKQTLKRDLKKWEDEREKRSKAGKKGMKSRWKNNNKTITNDNNVINNITKITDNVNVNVNVNDVVYSIGTFIEDFNKHRKRFLNIDAIMILKNNERYAFEGLVRKYNKQDFRDAISGLFKYSTLDSCKRRPYWLLEEANFIEMRDCFRNKTNPFKQKQVI